MRQDIESTVDDIKCAAELARKAVEDATITDGREVAHYAIYNLQNEVERLVALVEQSSHLRVVA